MKLHEDLNQRAVAHYENLNWVPSPTVGVNRKMLHRDGEEVAVATSFVKFDSNRNFPFHVHGGGEEFFVLFDETLQTGSFFDDALEYKIGYYVRHPIDSSHAPHSEDKPCLLLVKLRQMSDRTEQVHVVDTQIYQRKDISIPTGVIQGKWITKSEFLQEMILYENKATNERVVLEKYLPGYSQVFEKQQKYMGEELIVLKGSFEEEACENEPYKQSYKLMSWIRTPSHFFEKIKQRTVANSSSECIVFKKTGLIP